MPMVTIFQCGNNSRAKRADDAKAANKFHTIIRDVSSIEAVYVQLLFLRKLTVQFQSKQMERLSFCISCMNKESSLKMNRAC